MHIVNTLLNWIVSVELRWRVAAILLIVIAANPILYPLNNESIESMSVGEYKPVGAFSNIVERIRNQSMWIDKKIIAVVVAPGISDEEQKLIDAERIAGNAWVLIGLIHSADDRYAVLKRGEEFLHSIEVGDILSTGQQVLSIEEDSIVLSESDSDRRLVLYPTSF